MEFNDILIVEGRVQDAKKKYPEVPEEVWEVFIQNDPSGNNKYLDFLGRQWKRESAVYGISDKDGNIRHAKQFIVPVIQFHNVVDYLDPLKLQKELDSLGYDELRNREAILQNPKDIYTYQSVLNDLFIIARIGEKIKEEKELEKRVKWDVETIYEDKNILIILPKTWEASCAYSANTKWCISAKDYPNNFKEYSKANYIIFIIDKVRDLKYATLFDKTTNELSSVWNAADKMIEELPEQYKIYQDLITEWLNQNKKKSINLNPLVVELFYLIGDDNPDHYKLISQNSIKKILITHLNREFFAVIEWDYYLREYEKYINNWVKDKIYKMKSPNPKFIQETFGVNPYNYDFFYLSKFKETIKSLISKLFDEGSNDEIIEFAIENGLYQKQPEGYDDITLRELNKIEEEIEDLIVKNEELIQEINQYEGKIEFLNTNKTVLIDKYREAEASEETSSRDLEFMEDSIKQINNDIESYQNDIEKTQIQIEKNNLQIRQLKRLKYKIKTDNKGTGYSEEQIEDIFNILDKIQDELSDSPFIMMLYNTKDNAKFIEYFNINNVVQDIFKRWDRAKFKRSEIIKQIFPGVEIVRDLTNPNDGPVIFEVKIKELLYEARLKKPLKDTEGRNYSFRNSRACSYYEHEGWCEYLMDSMRQIENNVPNFKLLDISYFDQYHGPYAIVSFNDDRYRVWVLEDDMLYIENFPINNMDEDENPGYKNYLKKIIEMLKSYNQRGLHEARLKKQIKKVDNPLALPLAEFLEISPYELKEIDNYYYGLTQFETPDGEVYAIGTDEEADNAYEIFQRNFIEENGINGFSNWFQEIIINNYLDEEDFQTMLEEYFESYVDDIESEDSIDEEKYVNRLEEEMDEAGIINVEDEDYNGDYEDYKQEFIDYLTESVDNPVQYFIDNFGNDWVTEYIRRNDSVLDVDGIIEEIKESDGRGPALASYDGVENYIEFGGEYYYIYRL